MRRAVLLAAARNNVEEGVDAEELLAEVEAIAPHIEKLADGEGTPREQFFQGLLPPLRHASEGRVLFVQTDT